MVRRLRAEFNWRRDFVVARPFSFNGKAYVAGQPFEKTIDARKMRLLYDSRRLDMVEAKPLDLAAIAAQAKAAQSVPTDALEAGGLPTPTPGKITRRRPRLEPEQAEQPIPRRRAGG